MRIIKEDAESMTKLKTFKHWQPSKKLLKEVNEVIRLIERESERQKQQKDQKKET